MPLENVDRPLTLIAFLPDDLHKKVKHEDIVVKLMAKLSTDDVQCIQFMPNGYVRVTFTSMEARSEALLSGIFYDSLRHRVFEAQPAVFNVYVHHLPFSNMNTVRKQEKLDCIKQNFRYTEWQENLWRPRDRSWYFTAACKAGALPFELIPQITVETEITLAQKRILKGVFSLPKIQK